MSTETKAKPPVVQDPFTVRDILALEIPEDEQDRARFVIAKRDDGEIGTGSIRLVNNLSERKSHEVVVRCLCHDGEFHCGFDLEEPLRSNWMRTILCLFSYENAQKAIDKIRSDEPTAFILRWNR